MAIDLGPFKLLHPIGRGGMGVVWLGRHEAQGVPVAVKVITAKVANTEEYHRAFEQEVRAVGALDHPGVVWIFDSGKISAPVAAQSAGELVEGSPYLVMEYASHGTLRQWVRPLSWPEIRVILMSLLDALAHAHARGVLHRDLKPDNILIAGPDDLRPGFKITDFGIARPLDDTAIAEARPIGTPQYMAPEQIRNDTERYGPHTDLYAIGTLAWKLVTGKLPFHGMQGAPLMYAQLNKPPPKLLPQGDVPAGTERFLRTLLAKEPHERFQRAADAALALAELDQQEPELALTMPMPRQAPGLRLGEGGDGPDLELETATLKIVVTQRRKRPPAGEGSPVQQPPLPATWRLPDTGSRPLRLMGAGLGLFGLRPVPLVGREAERDLLWKAMREVHQEGRAQVVVVQGPAGVGRTRLLQWISERAHEVGGATVLRAAFTAANTALEQIRRSLVRLLQTNPLSPPLLARFEEVLGPELAALPLDAGIARLLDPEQTPLTEPQRHAAIRRIWELLSLDRPLFVTFDDVQWAPEALKLARHLLDVQERRPCRVLFVATVLEDALEGNDAVARWTRALCNRRSARIVPLKPFEGEQRVDLVQELLGLDIGLAEMVAERTDGNPLFATQLVGDWVNRGLLQSGRNGFVLADPDQPLPATLAEVWDGRIRALAQGLEPPALELLERAAVLGRDVDVLEWQAVCDDPEGRHAATGRTYFNPRHARLRAALMERLLAQRLAQATERGFVFTHAEFQKAVLVRAANAGRLKRHAATAAAILQSGLLETSSGTSSDGDAERLGRLLADSGQAQAATDALLRAEEACRRRSGAQAALDLLSEVERVLTQARIPKTQRHWAELATRRASAHAGQGQYAEAARAAALARQLAARGRWRDLEAQAAATAGQVAMRQGAVVEAEQHWLVAAERLGDDSDVISTVRAWHRLRRLAQERGDGPVAAECTAQVRRALQRASSEREVAAGAAALAEAALLEGQLDEAERLAQQAAQVTAKLHDLPGEAKARSLLAELAERREQLSGARQQWSLVIELLESLGNAALATLARCRLGLLECRAKDYITARQIVEVALAEGEPSIPWIRAAIHAVLSAASAGSSRWDRFDQHLQICELTYPSVLDRHPGYAEVMVLAGDLAIKRQQRERAVRAWTLAEGRLARLGHPDASALRRKIATLGAPP
jgi:tetratricopeptide (TPR) repeat protein